LKDFEKLSDRKKTPSLKFKKRKVTRSLTKTEGFISDIALKGLVCGISGTRILVETESSGCFECTTAGVVITKNENQSIVAVGDVVYILPDKNQSGKTATIIKVEERRNHFSRKEVGYEKEDVIAANIDILIVMLSVKSPKYNKRLLDRFLVTAELNNVEPIICINKIDLSDDINLKSDFDIYKKLKYQTFFISAKELIGMNELKEIINDKTCVLSGPSGSGKSTFINSMMGKSKQFVQETSNKTNKGRHTTSSVKMFKLSNGSRIIDTPGVREFGIWGLEKSELALYFHEFDDFNPKCKYYPCTHTHEPECAVIDALEKGMIDYGRYESYLNLFDSLS
jgi:ribosome biogenesis GTPase